MRDQGSAMHFVLQTVLMKETSYSQDLADRNEACKVVDQCVRRGLFQYSGLRVQPYGAFACGLASPTGSLDLTIEGCLTLSSLCSRDMRCTNSKLQTGLEGRHVNDLGREQHIELLRIAEHQLWTEGIVRERHTVTLSQVPVLSFRVASNDNSLSSPRRGTLCELTVGSGSAAFRATVLRQLTLVDPRFQQLVLLAKNWARKQGILGSSQGCLSFPCIILMVVFHLQTRPVPILPPFCQLFGLAPNVPSRQRPNGNGKTNTADLLLVSLDAIQKWNQRFRRNEESLAALLISFWKFYEGIFGKWAAGQDTANRLSPWTGKWRYAKWPTTGHMASIEDPFDASVNCAQSVSSQGLDMIRHRFQEANWVVSRLLSSPSGLQTSYELEVLFD